ncbi:MAG TPA: hypothetical protein VGN97_21955 [Mesorhizobium sp.]|jgi:hypothetical protein|nr:hypothetical protein [Mesorhizobium sp.]
MPIRQDPIAAIVTPALMTAFSRTVSPGRWGTYLEATGFNEEVALRLYLWNAAVGQSFHFPLQAAEVALRNVVSAAIAAEFCPNWWSDGACRAALGLDRCGEIDKAAQRIRRKYGVEPHTDQIVASLMLGFWAAMLKREHNPHLWATRTQSAFPHLGPGQGIRNVSSTTNTVQDLRNRIFHHEPLIGRNLSEDYAAILRLLGWICPETRQWVREHSSVPLVMRQRPRA